MEQYLEVVRRYWLSLAVFILIGAALAAFVNVTTPKSYTATAQSFVALSGQDADANPLNDAQFAAQRVKSYTELVSSPEVLRPVIKGLALSVTEQQLAGSVSATNPVQTVLINVSASNGDPVIAAQIANMASRQLGAMVERLETPGIKNGNPPVRVSLTEPATPPSSPSSPNVRTNLAAGVLVGVMAGLGWGFARSALDRSVKSPSELEDALGVPNLGVVTYDKASEAHSLPATETPSPHGEGYRTVRTNLTYVDIDNPPRVIGIVAAGDSDGKTHVACNFAAALASAGHSVCLLEGDLRSPGIADYLDISNATGLTSILRGESTIDDVIQPAFGGLISVVTAGAKPPNPSELLGSQAMTGILTELRSKFEYVIVDTPPLLAVSDAATLAANTDGQILVVRYRQTTREAVANAKETLEKVNARLLGTILNAAPKKTKTYGSYGIRVR